MKRLCVVLLAAMAVAGTAVVHAKVYRWVDDKGVVHFTAQPPADQREAEEVKVRAPTPSSSAKPEASDESADKAKSDNEYASQLSEACETAKKNYEAFANPDNVRFQTEDGEVVEFSPEEREQRTQEAKKQMEAYCRED